MHSTGTSVRRHDAALLFLIYPLSVVDGKMSEHVVDDVIRNLQGEYGIRRYLGISYWTADYKDKVAADELTADVSEHQESRDKLVNRDEEAQWCIFDPIISIIAGQRYLRNGDPSELQRQVLYLNRSLGQITGPDCLKGKFALPRGLLPGTRKIRSE